MSADDMFGGPNSPVVSVSKTVHRRIVEPLDGMLGDARQNVSEPGRLRQRHASRTGHRSLQIS